MAAEQERRRHHLAPQTFENSQRKAYAARTYRSSSGEFAQRLDKVADQLK